MALRANQWAMAGLDVLVLDDPDSQHARLVQTAVLARGATCKRLNCADLGDRSVEIRPGEFRFRSGGSEWEVSSSTTVWYRRLGSTGIDGDDLAETQFIRDEMPHVLIGGLIACGVRWIDEPFDVDRAERKLFQLSTASRMGIPVPQTTTTNDPATAVEMATAGRVVAKALSPGLGIAPSVEEVGAGDLGEFGGLPTLLQELVASADADLRVVVIGPRAWAWRRPRTHHTVDWRAEDASGTGFELMSLHTVERDAIDLTCALGLTMSVQDWLETPDGLVFLEANPQGAWAFLDRSEEFVPDALAIHLADQSGVTLNEGGWPKPLKRVRWDLGCARKAPPDDGAVAPRFASPPWASLAARSSSALSVVRRANDEATAGAKAAEDKAARLSRTALTTLALTAVLIGYQLQVALTHASWWFVSLTPVLGAFVCLAIAGFEATEIDRVGFYRHPTGRDLAEPGSREPIVKVIEQEDIGRRLAGWSSQHKHTALMQARAWFTRGLAFLVAASIVAAISWAFDSAATARTPTPTEDPAADYSTDD